MMANEDYTPVKDDDGKDYLCPVAAPAEPENADTAFSDCVEKNVTERYSGNFNVKS